MIRGLSLEVFLLDVRVVGWEFLLVEVENERLELRFGVLSCKDVFEAVGVNHSELAGEILTGLGSSEFLLLFF